MKKKICSFAMNFTHACIISNNFIQNNFKNSKIIYINEEKENEEDEIYKHRKDKLIYVVYGGEKFVEKVNDYLKMKFFDGYIIDIYNLIELKNSVPDIIENHEYYINSSEIFYMKNRDNNIDVK